MTDWWRGAVIYQVYPRSFQDSNGDGVGDLPGIMRRLDHIASLGVDCIWLSPINQSPQKDMGYDVSDYKEVDRLFGSLEDFDQLIERAHALGLKVIIDQVLSHSSDMHPWFRESRLNRTNAKADWYVWADPKRDGSPPNNWPSVFGGRAWEWNPSRGQYYFHNFLIEQPDLNFHNPDVQDAVLDVMRFWLERGVDGFRLDTVNYYFHNPELRDNPPKPRGDGEDLGTNPYGYQFHEHDKTQPQNPAFLQRFRALLDEFGGRAAVGEVGDEERSLETVAAYVSGGDKLHMCYTFDLLSPEFSAAHIRKCVSDFEGRVSDGWICWAFSNHDVVRHVSRWTRPGGDPQRVASFAIDLLVSLRGSICLYQGEELGLPEAELAFEDLRDPYGIRFWPAFKGRDGCRTPMVWDAGRPNGGFSTGKPWLPVPANHLPLVADRQERDSASVMARYRRMLAFRKEHPALVEGDIAFFEAPDEVLAFVRATGNERLLCLFNFGDEPVEWSLPNDLGPLEPLDLPGQGAGIGDSAIRLGGFASFFAKIA